MNIEDKDDFLFNLKSLWTEAKATGDEWLLGFVESAEFFVKNDLPLTNEVIEILKSKIGKYNIKNANVAYSLIIIGKQLIARKLKSDKNFTKDSWSDYKKEHPDTKLHPNVVKEDDVKKEETKEQSTPKVEDKKEEPKKESLPKKEESPKKQENKKETSNPELVPSTKYPTIHIFTPDEEKLPESVNQPIKVSDPTSEAAKKEIYQQAEAAHHVMLQVLDNGGPLQKALGMEHYDGMGAVEESGALDKPGAVLVTGKLKGEERASEKVKTSYGGDWTRLTDVVRASIGVDDYKSVGDVLKKVKEAGLKIAKKPKDRFSKPTPVGYRDVMLNIQFPNGHIGELQLHVKSMMKAKNVAHGFYETLRKFQDAQDQKRRDLKPEEEEAYDKAFKDSLDVYNKAWDGANENAGAKTNASARIRLTTSRIRLTAKMNQRVRLTTGGIIMASNDVKYYELDEMPVYRKPHQLPVQLIGDNKERVIYDMFYFDHNSSQINEQEYKERKRKLGYE